MENNHDLLQALDGIRMELQQLNKTLSGMAAQQNRPAPKAAFSDAPARPSSSARSYGPGRPFASGRPSAGPARTGGYKRKSEDGEPTGYGAEMSARFPSSKRSSTPKSKGKPPAKKGSGYPKKPR